MPVAGQAIAIRVDRCERWEPKSRTPRGSVMMRELKDADRLLANWDFSASPDSALCFAVNFADGCALGGRYAHHPTAATRFFGMQSMSSRGPLTRTVADAELVLRAMACGDAARAFGRRNRRRRSRDGSRQRPRERRPRPGEEGLRRGEAPATAHLAAVAAPAGARAG